MDSPGSWLTVGAAIFAVRFVASEAFFEKSSIQRGKLIFPPVLGIRIVFGLGVPGFLFLAARIAQTEDLRRSWFVFVFSLSVPILMAIFMPGTFILDKSGIRERKWFGLKSKTINWSNVEYVFSSPAERLFTIGSQDGCTMTHTAYHVDRDAFRDALKRYCKKYVARD
jgi:hypothetical protein